LTFFLGRDVFLFGVNKLPNLINLNLSAFQIAKRAVLVITSGNAHSFNEV